MPSVTADVPSSANPAPARAARRYVWPWVFVAWTVFVWAGRIKLADAEVGPLLLALTFLVPAVALAVALVWFRGAVPALVGALALWTTGVWVVRDLDIVLGGDHPVPFVVVHVVLGVVSVAVAGLALRSVLRPGREVSVTSA